MKRVYQVGEVVRVRELWNVYEIMEYGETFTVTPEMKALSGESRAVERVFDRLYGEPLYVLEGCEDPIPGYLLYATKPDWKFEVRAYGDTALCDYISPTGVLRQESVSLSETGNNRARAVLHLLNVMKNRGTDNG